MCFYLLFHHVQSQLLHAHINTSIKTFTAVGAAAAPFRRMQETIHVKSLEVQIRE